MEETQIGDFSKPLIGKPTTASAAGDTKVRLEAAEQNLESEANAAEAALKPLKSYEARLEEVKVTKEQAADIIDAVLMKGYWSETISVTSRINLKLRTRSARDTRRIQDYLEVARPQYDAHYNEILSRMTLAASLEQFGKDVFAFPGKEAKTEDYEEAFQKRSQYIESLADPALRLLFMKLWTFDEKIRVVLSEGTIENF